ncbi:MAG TPA: substrate-binding domain-containing protein [Candidatus Solibacter sp.]|jgi:LacI family transcriptional regulator|nr:substrate-binding domain-containing protein [Candidatus Solibacter sp.]
MGASSAKSTVGVIVSDIGNPFYIDVVRGLSDRLEEEGRLLLIGDCLNDEARQAALARDLVQRGVAGLVVTVPHAKEVFALDVPVVAVDRPPLQNAFVSADNLLGGRIAAEHLARCGYSDIGILYAEDNLAPVADRIAGFRDGLERRSVKVRPELAVRCGGLDYDSAYEGAQQLLDAGADGIFAISDVMATAVLAVATENGRGVPDQVGIVGYDDTPIASWPTVNLTSVAQGTYSLGEEAARLLLKQIASPLMKQQPTILSPRLVIRGSTRPAA